MAYLKSAWASFLSIPSNGGDDTRFSAQLPSGQRPVPLLRGCGGGLAGLAAHRTRRYRKGSGRLDELQQNTDTYFGNVQLTSVCQLFIQDLPPKYVFICQNFPIKMPKMRQLISIKALTRSELIAELIEVPSDSGCTAKFLDLLGLIPSPPPLAQWGP